MTNAERISEIEKVLKRKINIPDVRTGEIINFVANVAERVHKKTCVGDEFIESFLSEINSAGFEACTQEILAGASADQVLKSEWPQ